VRARPVRAVVRQRWRDLLFHPLAAPAERLRRWCRPTRPGLPRRVRWIHPDPVPDRRLSPGPPSAASRSPSRDQPAQPTCRPGRRSPASISSRSGRLPLRRWRRRVSATAALFHRSCRGGWTVRASPTRRRGGRAGRGPRGHVDGGRARVSRPGGKSRSFLIERYASTCAGGAACTAPGCVTRPTRCGAPSWSGWRSRCWPPRASPPLGADALSSFPGVTWRSARSSPRPRAPRPPRLYCSAAHTLFDCVREGWMIAGAGNRHGRKSGSAGRVLANGQGGRPHGSVPQRQTAPSRR